MNAEASVRRRMCAAIDAFEARNTKPYSHAAYVEFCDLLVVFAAALIDEAETEGRDIDASSFDDLLSSITYFQDRVSETKPPDGGHLCTL